MSARRDAVHEQYAHQILAEIESGAAVSQRSLARRLGIALGMTNLLMRRVVRKGWVRVARIPPGRVKYFLTPTGMAEKARMSRAYLQDSLRFYASARDRIRISLADISHRWPGSQSPGAAPGKRIVFLGTGAVAEIAYLCLQETDLQLLGAIDLHGRDTFFGVRVIAADAFNTALLEELGGARVAVMAFSETDELRACLAESGVPAAAVSWI